MSATSPPPERSRTRRRPRPATDTPASESTASESPASESPLGTPPDAALEEALAYFEATRRPFPCLVFLAPLFIAYEVGVLSLGSGRGELLRGAADGWMRSWFYAAGIHQSFLLPLVVLGLLLLWNFYGYFEWRVRTATLGGMLAESLIYAGGLVLVGQALQLVCQHCGLPTAVITAAHTTAAHSAAEPDAAQQSVARAVSYIGAGIYEEVLFRLMLLPVMYGTFRVLQAGRRSAATLAVLVTSLGFALAHYVGPAGDTLMPFTFCFRAAAGVVFAGLFVTRGFGITVGTHAVYDLIVGVLWA